jgi:hypothetical protein
MTRQSVVSGRFSSWPGANLRAIDYFFHFNVHACAWLVKFFSRTGENKAKSRAKMPGFRGDKV